MGTTAALIVKDLDRYYIAVVQYDGMDVFNALRNGSWNFDKLVHFVREHPAIRSFGNSPEECSVYEDHDPVFWDDLDSAIENTWSSYVYLIQDDHTFKVICDYDFPDRQGYSFTLNLEAL